METFKSSQIAFAYCETASVSKDSTTSVCLIAFETAVHADCLKHFHGNWIGCHGHCVGAHHIEKIGQAAEQFDWQGMLWLNLPIQSSQFRSLCLADGQGLHRAHMPDT